MVVAFRLSLGAQEWLLRRRKGARQVASVAMVDAAGADKISGQRTHLHLAHQRQMGASLSGLFQLRLVFS